MECSKYNARVFWPIFLVTIVAVSVWASPFRYDYEAGGRYLTVVAKKMDPGMFPGDPVVAALARFDSLYYRALPAVLSGPERFESDLFKIFVGMKIAQMLSLFWLMRTLTKEPMAAVLLLAWWSKTSAALLGGSPLFANIVTHSEIAQVLGILAVVCAVRSRYWGFWPLLCLAVFIHSLVTIHLLACVFPVILFGDRPGRAKFLLGAAGFCLCFLCYMHWMTPPRMSAEEAGIFLRAKGDMQHVSPLAQGVGNYLKFGLVFALAFLGQRRWLSAEPGARLLINFVMTGTVVSLMLGFATVFGHSLSITQVQPMRIFFWVTVFLQVIIAWAAGAALQERHPVAWALLGVILFSMADSLWAEGLAVIAIAGIWLDWVWQRAGQSKALARWSERLMWGFALVVVACALSGNKPPLQSVRTPWLIALGAGLPALMKVSEWNGTRTLWPAFGLCLCAAAIGMQHGWAAAQEKDRKSGRNDWLAICEWCRKNSAKGDRFLTPPREDNFRLHALRSSIGEEMSALVWVDPRAYESNTEEAAALRTELKNGCWDLNGLRAAARTNGIRYVLVDGPFRPAHHAEFTAGAFSLHRADDY
jgi:hypothetical protein